MMNLKIILTLIYSSTALLLLCSGKKKRGPKSSTQRTYFQLNDDNSYFKTAISGLFGKCFHKMVKLLDISLLMICVLGEPIKSPGAFMVLFSLHLTVFGNIYINCHDLMRVHVCEGAALSVVLKQ